MRRPLDDVRVLAIEQFGAGPWATLQLADLGAEVRGREVCEDLVRVSDAFYSNLRGDQPAKLRITYEDLEALNPRIVCCSLSGFGNTGPRAKEPAYDYVLQAMAGWMSLTGEPDGPPTKSGLSLVDFSGGTGCDCDTSLFETALSLLAYVGTWAATEGHVTERRAESAHPSIVPFQAFQTADGWITVACAKEKFWLALRDALDLPDDPRFAGFEERAEHREELLDVLRPRFRAETTDALVARLSAAGVPFGAVNDVLGALEDPQIAARDAVIAYEHPRLGEVRQIASPLRMGAEYRRAPARGEHTEALLRELCGYDADRLARARASGAFSAP